MSKSPSSYDPFKSKNRKKKQMLKRQLSAMEKSIISSNAYPYDRIITLKSEYAPGARPKERIPVVLASKEGLSRPHDLIMLVPGDKGNNRFSYGNSICIGTFPDRQTALQKKRELKSDFLGASLKSPNAKTVLGRSSWTIDEEIVVRPSSIVHEDAKPIKTGKVTSRKNCDCLFRK